MPTAGSTCCTEPCSAGKELFPACPIPSDTRSPPRSTKCTVSKREGPAWRPSSSSIPPASSSCWSSLSEDSSLFSPSSFSEARSSSSCRSSAFATSRSASSPPSASVSGIAVPAESAVCVFRASSSFALSLSPCSLSIASVSPGTSSGSASCATSSPSSAMTEGISSGYRRSSFARLHTARTPSGASDGSASNRAAARSLSSDRSSPSAPTAPEAPAGPAAPPHHCSACSRSEHREAWKSSTRRDTATIQGCRFSDSSASCPPRRYCQMNSAASLGANELTAPAPPSAAAALG
mmetsp:Transcript_76547/g.206837  ORF Transcript_76547/g.206837 Transcript_76547/m.206837 type:complete len:293 (-) Transcript_76547:58-936(-)